MENVLVIVDDLALPVGALRLKGQGSDGGHNGLKHIAATLGTTNYARLRFGIGNDFGKGHQVNFVLGAFDSDEQKVIESIVPEKDVDCFHAVNVGKMLLGRTDGFFPCTPYGVMILLEKSGVETAGKHVVVIGRSNIVGKPQAMLQISHGMCEYIARYLPTIEYFTSKGYAVIGNCMNS